MQTAVPVKAGVAFMAGVVLALGGAYTYFKVADAHIQSAVQPTAKTAESASSVPDLATTPKQPDPVPTNVETPAQPVAAVVKPAPKLIHPKLILPKPKVTGRPDSLAVANGMVSAEQLGVGIDKKIKGGQFLCGHAWLPEAGFASGTDSESAVCLLLG